MHTPGADHHARQRVLIETDQRTGADEVPVLSRAISRDRPLPQRSITPLPVQGLRNRSPPGRLTAGRPNRFGPLSRSLGGVIARVGNGNPEEETMLTYLRRKYRSAYANCLNVYIRRAMIRWTKAHPCEEPIRMFCRHDGDRLTTFILFEYANGDIFDCWQLETHSDGRVTLRKLGGG